MCSRGAKLSCLLASQEERVKGLVLLDPVDNTAMATGARSCVMLCESLSFGSLCTGRGCEVAVLFYGIKIAYSCGRSGRMRRLMQRQESI